MLRRTFSTVAAALGGLLAATQAAANTMTTIHIPAMAAASAGGASNAAGIDTSGMSDTAITVLAAFCVVAIAGSVILAGYALFVAFRA